MSMFDKHVVEIEWGGRPLTLEAGQVARQADGSVIVTYGETTVMCNVVSQRSPKPGLDFFPLTVNYIEKAYAAGKIPGGFFKREARPSENETLVCRLIDRPIRPLFADGYKNDTQVTCTVLSPRYGKQSRYRCHDCHICSIDHFRCTFPGPDWRRTRWPH